MSEKTKLVPKRRFKEFENADAWEQCRLGELGRVSSGNTPPTSEKENWANDYEGHVWITPTDIDSLVMSDSERHLTDFGWEKARTVPANSVLITSVASIGKNTINAVPVAFNQQINAIVPEGNDAYFILSSMENEMPRFAGLAGQTATAIINKTEFEKFTLFVPAIQEQQKIGSFFTHLDNLITLHQRKLEKAKEIKSAYLSEMFPAEGERKPKRRFTGFTDAWEQWKLGEAFDFLPNNTLSRTDLNNENGEIQSVHYGDILIKYGSVLDVENEDISFITGGNPTDYKRHILNNGDVLFADTAEDETVGKAVEIQGTNGIPVVSGLHTMACRPKIKFAPNYLGYYINSPAYHGQLRTLMQGIKVLSISKTNLSKTAVVFPTSEDEQNAIGKLFTHHDHLITLHQRTQMLL